MKIKVKNVRLSRTLLAALLAGLICAVIVGVFVYNFRHWADSTTMVIFSPLVLFIGIPLVFLLAGIIFFELAHWANGPGIYKVIFAILTLLVIAIDLEIFSGNFELTGSTRLVFGMELINGLLLTFLLPFLATHPRLFMTGDGLMFSDQEDE